MRTSTQVVNDRIDELAIKYPKLKKKALKDKVGKKYNEKKK